MKNEKIVIALGGNAIKQSHEKGTTDEQFKHVDITAEQIAAISKAGYEIVLTHGNGPQAGALLIQQEEGKQLVPAQTLAICGAMTQGQIGWMLQNRIDVHLKKAGVPMNAATVVTQVVVSEDDPDFHDPSKPVGPFYTEAEAKELETTKGYQIREVKPGTEKGWRRVVPSPEPLDIVEHEAINTLSNLNFLVIASGGGGIPVGKREDGSYYGIDAVIDKDRAAFKLAQIVKADKLIILTDVEKVCLNYNTPQQKELDQLSLAQVDQHSRDGHFLKGSMGPKVQAAARFVKWSGKEAIITSLQTALDALEGKTGTHIVP